MGWGRYIKAGFQAISKARADDAAAAIKKAKEAADKAALERKLKKAYDEGAKAGAKKGAKKVKRRIAAGATALGAAYVEGKTGALSKAAKWAKDKYDKRNAKPLKHTGAPLKPKGEQKPTWRSTGGAKAAAQKAAAQKKKTGKK